MRLCQPYFRALSRGFVAIWLLSGVMMALWLVGIAAFARLIDAQIAHRPLPELLPLVAIVLIALGGALVVQLARDTLLNRRRIWLDHRLAEVVLAHELWRGSEARHRNRSLAAVDALGRFVGSPAAKALAEAPWAMAIVGGLWTLDADIAAVTSAAMLILLALALSGGRLTRSARQFDTTVMSVAAGQDLLHTIRLDTGLSLDDARLVAGRWETTQRNRVVAQYAYAQSYGRTRIGTAILVALATAAMAVLAITTSQGLSMGGLTAICLAGCGALLSVSRWVVDAGEVAAARSARRLLGTLRVARSRSGELRRPSVAAPDLRGPIAGALFATAASVAGLTLVVNYWQLPVLSIVHDTFAVHQLASAPSHYHQAVPKGLS